DAKDARASFVAFLCNLEQTQRPRGRSRRWLFGCKDVRSRLPDLTQSGNDTRTELRSGISLDFGERVYDRPTASVWTVGRDRLESITVVAEALCECDRDGCDPAGVKAGVEILRLHAPRQRSNRVAMGAAEPDVRLANLVHRRGRPFEVPASREHHQRRRHGE